MRSDATGGAGPGVGLRSGAGTGAGLEREAIVARLREIAALLELHGGNKFKSRAFVRGARSLEASRVPVETLVAEKRLEDLPGIGTALARQIEELHCTGRSELLTSLREGLPAGVLELSQVAGIGLHALRTLHERAGVSTIDDLRRAAREGRLRDVKGFGAKKEAKILEAIARYEAEGPTVRLADGLRLADELEREIGAIAGVASVHLGGALRRSAELAEDVTLVVGLREGGEGAGGARGDGGCASETELVVADAGGAPARVVDAIAALPRVATIERRDSGACRLRLADGTRVDVVTASAAALPLALAFAESARAHFDKLVSRAAERGMRLARDGLFARDGTRADIADERALYEALGLSYVPPELREDSGEIEAAARGESFEDLVDRADLRGFVHCHTTWSDGKGSIEEMARAAKERGAEFITITDHSTSAFYAGGVDASRLARQWDDIDEAQERVGIRILKGTEADILADGALDWPDSILDRLDVVIASIHNRHKQDEEKMTARVLRAMRHPVFKIWGHPLGRLVTSRPPIPLRVEEVLDALAESRGAIEINGDPHRLDIEPRWGRAARARGIPFVLSVDAHSVGELGNVRYAVGLARRAGVRRREVLNARGAEAFARAVRPAA